MRRDRRLGFNSLERLDHPEDRVDRDAHSGGNACRDTYRTAGDDHDVAIDIGSIGEVVDAMAEVERGRIDTSVGVYERSEIGRLQSGFNRMVAGIAERDRLRDLFGRHVGADVASRAIEEGTSLSGEVTEAAILFIDLVGSTMLAASRPPQEVAEVLNDFFRIVVSAVDERNGLINKFQGDAALAVFWCAAARGWIGVGGVSHRP